MEDLIGKQLGAFQIVAPLGEGGMASVYKAYQPRMDRYVALKILPRFFSKNPEFVSRFSLEARVIAKLEHPNILPVYDFGESDGYTYLAMRLVEGGSLSDLLKERGKLTLSEISRIISQVGGAIDYAHQQGVIHRDIKPENVLTDAFENCLLTDFGIAKMVEATTHLTHTGGILGTPSYVSPEQGTGKPIDHRSDIYSLGVVLYRMAVGKLPYKADTPMGVVFQHCFDPIPLPRQHAPELPEPVERVILKALAKEPDDRFETAGDMVKAMQEAVETPPVSEPVRQVAETSPEMPVEMPEHPPPEPLEPEKPAAPVDKFPDDEETMLEPAPPKAGRKLPWVVAVAVVLAVAASAAWFWVQKTKLPAPVITSLFVDTEPNNAAVKLLDSDVPFHQGINLKLGRYQLEVSAEGYETRKVMVELDAKGEKRVDIQLNPLVASLFVNADPSRALIKLLNSDLPFRQGITLKLGRYQLEVSANGYETEKTWVTLDTTGEKRVDIELKRGKKILNALGMEFVYIPPGTFTMGSPSNEPGRDKDEKQHQVTLTKGFYMQTTEVTQGQWKAVSGSNPSYFKDCGNECPVEKVSWNDAQEFIRKLNRREGSGTYRLPTEAEWEYAARAGTNTPFSFGRCLSTSQANYDGNYPLSGCAKGENRKRTIAVASFSPNAWGLFDMHGNVWEWCQDWYGNYPSGSVTNPKGNSSGSDRVLRGGGWYDFAGFCRSALRYWYFPGDRRRLYGFRLVLLPGQ